MTEAEIAIQHTQKWITEVVIGCNFCPFAAKELRKNAVHYSVENTDDMEDAMQSFLQQCIYLDEHDDVSTSLLIFPNSFRNFDDFLDLVALAEILLKRKKYEGVYQVASFHPCYLFAGAPIDDPANFTNRSPYPMLHLLREDLVEEVLDKYPNPEKIPENNIKFSREKGHDYMEKLRLACMPGIE